MAYSRWGSRGSGHWYTFWLAQDEKTENRDTAVFEVCTVTSFTAKQLREDMDGCMDEVRRLDPASDVHELRGYAIEFLADIDSHYPPRALGKIEE